MKNLIVLIVAFISLNVFSQRRVRTDNLIISKLKNAKVLATNEKGKVFDGTDYIIDLIGQNENTGDKNVQSNWLEKSSLSDAFILNKPTKLSDFTNDLVFPVYQAGENVNIDFSNPFKPVISVSNLSSGVGNGAGELYKLNEGYSLNGLNSFAGKNSVLLSPTTVSNSESFVFGKNNSSVSGAVSACFLGKDNTLSSNVKDGFFIGNGLTLNNSVGGSTGNKSSTVLLGQFNATVNDRRGVADSNLIVGGGTSLTDRKTLINVYNDGLINAPSTTIESILKSLNQRALVTTDYLNNYFSFLHTVKGKENITLEDITLQSEVTPKKLTLRDYRSTVNKTSYTTSVKHLIQFDLSEFLFAGDEVIQTFKIKFNDPDLAFYASNLNTMISSAYFENAETENRKLEVINKWTNTGDGSLYIKVKITVFKSEINPLALHVLTTTLRTDNANFKPNNG